MLDIINSAKHSLRTELPYISVVIPVRCEFEGLSSLLPELMKQDYPHNRWEILVTDGQSTDRTPELVIQFAITAPVSIRLLQNVGVRSSAGRNVGISAAKGDIIVFIDGHCNVPSYSLLLDTAQIFQQTNADCLCRPQPLNGSCAHPMGKYIAEIRRSAFGHGRGSMIYNLDFAGFIDPRSSGASYRSSVFEQVGLYDESFDACEDVELNVRVALNGMRAYTDPKLAINYQARNNLSALLKQMMRYGRGRIRLAKKHRGERSLSSMAPMFLCLFMIAPLLCVQNEILFLLASAPALLYSAAVLIATMQLVVRSRRMQLMWGLAIYPIIHLGLGLGMLLEAASLCRKAPQSWAGRPNAASM